MKWTSVTLNVGKVRRIGERVGLLGRIYIGLSLGSAIFFVLLGLGGIYQAKVHTSPAASMQGLAAVISSRFFIDMIGMEVPYARTEDEQLSTFSSRNVSQFLFQYLANINPYDPKSLLAGEVPLLETDDAFILRSSSGTDLAAAPQDLQPGSVKNGESSPDGSGSHEVGSNENGNTNQNGNETTSNADPAGNEDKPSVPGTTDPRASNGGTTDNTGTATPGEVKATTGGRKVVFIYNSHNRESYFPILKKGAKIPEDSKKNVTLLSTRLAKRLEELGIGAHASKTDYASTVKGYNWNFSYKYSLKTIQAAVTSNPDIKFLFDIHRDSQPKSKTTVSINGVKYAQVFFIIGHMNPDWKENEEFASQIQVGMETKYPGISRGIWGKSSKKGNGEYNQHVSPYSTIIEIGGVENTLEECYRTVDVLSKIIADVYWKAEKVDGVPDKKNKDITDKGKLAIQEDGKRG
ncbi:hypothetical protein SY83_14530 [Paenibacillus swuensis]|uniref:Stage II sporulation protein P n=1 Tax=Paenibacillus swuensis TaxID=1178515 RepID=A0A172TJX7_9BACL|nr:stage II sporulation protein P [Paenibacillus swuensis]ANE47282.1 hypothetical protein SY83_14530 [Paenibacillus swuensis]